MSQTPYLGRVHADRPSTAGDMDADTLAYAHRMFALATAGFFELPDMAELLKRGRPA
jgi:hypothetical protein